MPASAVKNLSEIDPILSGKGGRLLFGRVALLFLLLMANLWQAGSLTDRIGGQGSDDLLIAFSVTVGLTIVYAAGFRYFGPTIWQIRLQFAADLILITWLVMGTGEVVSPYTTLYVVLISVSGFFLDRLETLLIAICCAAAFTLLSFTASDLFLIGPSTQSPSRILQILGVNVVAILLVGLLAARLSERRRLTEELRHSEASFADLHLLHERIVESISSGLVTADLAGTIYAFNKAAEEITGLVPSKAVGLSLFEIFGEEIRPYVEDCIGWKDRPDPIRFESHLELVLGKRVTAECTIVPLLAKSGKQTGLIVTLRDITPIRMLEENLRRSDRLAAVGRMAAGLAHEIRNPLGSMSSALQFLKEGSDRPVAETDLMDVVLRESDRMNSIITNFLTYARPTAKGSASTRARIDMSRAVGDCISLIRHSPEVSDRHKILFVDPARAVEIDGDETKIKQVFWNLARNAINAMPDGGTLSVEVRRSDSRVTVSFTDTGKGFDEAVLAHLFEPFNSGAHGTGLGLSIVYKIVEEHAGEIFVESELGVGSKIRVELPAADKNSDTK